MKNNIDLLDKILFNYRDLVFTDVSGTFYKIFKKESIHIHLDYYYIKVTQQGVGKHKISNGVRPPILKEEWRSYCIDKGNDVFALHQQYLTNIVIRGYIKVVKFGKPIES